MDETAAPKRWPDFRFNLEEISGAVGDYGTLIPIILGVAVVSDIRLGPVILFFALFYIATGLWYRAPVPVEPMKAVGAVVIAEGLSSGEIAASGIVIGAVFLAIGALGGMKRLQDAIPQAVIRGVQLGLALLLLKTSLKFIVPDPLIAAVCIGIVLFFFVLKRFREVPDLSAFVILGLGVIIALMQFGVPPVSLIALPSLVIPDPADFVSGTWQLVIPQLPLTMTNAILATSLLMKDLVGRDIDPDRLSRSIGVMNLSSCLFGGFPVCHGAGGLAAQYRFGARTGGSNIISGLILLPVALFFATPEFVNMLPTGIFGALLVFVGIELAKSGLRTGETGLVVLMGLVALASNITVAFIIGIVLSAALARRKKTP
jgi:MFS superfamily sulfate permease-like transporter